MTNKISKLYSKIFAGRDFAKNTTTLMLGTILAQLIPILLQPILRRIFSPEEFGAFSVYQSLIGIFTMFVTLRYDLAIVLPKKEKTAANLLFLSFGLNLIISTILFFVLLIFGDPIAILLDFPSSHRVFMYFVPLGVFMFCFYQSINYWLIRKKAFVASAANKVSRRAAEGIIQTGSGFAKISGGLIIGDLFGNLINCSVGIWQMLRQGYKQKFISRVQLNYVAKKYIEFPKYNLLPTLLSACGSLIPILFINKFYNAQTVGFFDLSRQMLSIPFALVSMSIAQVLLQRLTEKKNQLQSIKKDLTSVFWFLGTIVIIELIVILFWGPFLFGLFFGKIWNTSGTYSQIMVFSYVTNFIVSSFTGVFISLNKIKLYSIWQTFYFGAICLLLLFKGIEFTSFLKIFVFIDLTMYLMLLILIIFVVNNYEKKINPIHA
ncbi:MAG: oligosaccharide flippase family protein [Bacteroidota bacterium]